MTLINQAPSTSGATTSRQATKEEKKALNEPPRISPAPNQLSSQSLLDYQQQQQQQQQQRQGPLWAQFVGVQANGQADKTYSYSANSTKSATLFSTSNNSNSNDINHDYLSSSNKQQAANTCHDLNNGICGTSGAHDQIWSYYNQQQLQQQQQDQQTQLAQEEAQAKEKKKKKKKRRNSFDSIFSLNSEFDEFEGQTVRFKPESIDNLVKLTKFNKRELKLMYRGFKQLCPSGVVKEDKFKLIYAQFFPRGAETNHYARFVFNTFDVQRKQEITFTDFVIGLSVLTRGTIEERLRWIFTLYDINGDGVITKDELSKIVCSIYDLMGKLVDQPSDEITAREQTDRLFKKFDLNCDGIITLDEFLESCHNDENIIKSISVFNTVL